MGQSTGPSLARRGVHLLVGVVVASTALAACGGDNKGAARATHEEWFTAACAQLNGVDPGFDAFFEAHPEPTLADWAAFLPTPIDEVQKFIVAVNLPHPAADDANFAAVIAAVNKLQATWQATIDAANAGDQATFDALDAQAQDVDSPAMEAALHAAEPDDCP